MFVRLFYTLRKYGVPVTTRELIDLNRAVSEGLVFADQEDFYQLAKTILVKDERFFDKFDRAIFPPPYDFVTLSIEKISFGVLQLWADFFCLLKVFLNC